MKTLILVVLTVAITPVLAQELDLRFDSGVAKACDKAEIDLHGPVLAAIVPNGRRDGCRAGSAASDFPAHICA